MGVPLPRLGLLVVPVDPWILLPLPLPRRKPLVGRVTGSGESRRRELKGWAFGGDGDGEEDRGGGESEARAILIALSTRGVVGRFESG